MPTKAVRLLSDGTCMVGNDLPTRKVSRFEVRPSFRDDHMLNHVHAAGELAPDSAIKFLRLPSVCERTGLSRTQVYRLEAEGKFPRRVKLGLSTSAWVESEIQGWAAARIAASRGDA